MDEPKFDPQNEPVTTNGHQSHPEVENLIKEFSASTPEGTTLAGEPSPLAAPENRPVMEPPSTGMAPAPAVTPTPADLAEEKQLLGNIIREYAEAVITTVIIAMFITTFLIQAYKIPTGSMESNLLIGDHLLVNKFVFSREPAQGLRLLPFKEIKRGDILVFKFPENPDQAYVKRVIGLPGDTVTIIEKQVQVNGEPLDEDYTQFIGSESAYRPIYSDWTVPEGQYFMLGDNRDNSRDSREWGFVPREYVIGKPLLIYWSFETEPNEHQRTLLSERIEQLKDVLFNFPTKTRWDRTFKVVK